jgi:hypothetical protein
MRTSKSNPILLSSLSSNPRFILAMPIVDENLSRVPRISNTTESFGKRLGPGPNRAVVP